MKQILLFIVLFPCLLFGQTQLGSDIDGEEVGDIFGSSVSISSDGLTIAVGAPRNDGTNSSAGHVRVYRYDAVANDWTQLGLDIDGEAGGDNSGTSVSISSDGLIVAIGAIRNDGSISDEGHVRVYRFDAIANDWVQLGLDINGEAIGDRSGFSVSLSDDGLTVAIGAQENDGENAASAVGHVRVYRFDTTSDNWLQLGLDIDGEDIGNRSGFSVSLSNDGLTVAIGARNNSSTASNAGHVRVYRFDDIIGDWLQLGLDIDGEAEADESGTSVSLSDDGLMVAIGASENDGSFFNAGHVRIYRFDLITDAWLQLGTDIDGEAFNDRSGTSVSLSSDGLTVAIGAPENDNSIGGTNFNAGHVRVYRFDAIADDWIQLGIDINGEVSSDASGTSVSLSSDGLTVAIGAPENDSGGASNLNFGHVRVFDLSSALSTEDFVLANFIIYPNPTSTILNIELKNGLILEKATIYNTIGQLVQTVHSNTINVSKLNTGMYYVQVFTDKGIGTKQIIVD